MPLRRHFVFLSTPRIGWFGLGIASKAALAVIQVFFSGFFHVCQGVREIGPVILARVCK